MKKVLCLLLIVTFTFSIAATACAIEIDLSSMSDKELKQLKGQVDKELTRRAAATSLASGDVGDYHIDILSVETTNDMLGADAVLVTYLLTNNSSKSASVYMGVSVKVYQDGVGCNETYTMDGLTDMMKDVQPGGTITLSKAFALNNDYDDITIEISDGFSFYGNSAPAMSVTLELP